MDRASCTLRLWAWGKPSGGRSASTRPSEFVAAGEKRPVLVLSTGTTDNMIPLSQARGYFRALPSLQRSILAGLFFHGKVTECARPRNRQSILYNRILPGTTKYVKPVQKGRG